MYFTFASITLLACHNNVIQHYMYKLDEFAWYNLTTQCTRKGRFSYGHQLLVKHTWSSLDFHFLLFSKRLQKPEWRRGYMLSSVSNRGFVIVTHAVLCNRRQRGPSQHQYQTHARLILATTKRMTRIMCVAESVHWYGRYVIYAYTNKFTLLVCYDIKDAKKLGAEI